MNKFEVGKKYKHKSGSTVYICIYADDVGGLVSYDCDGKRAFLHHIYLNDAGGYEEYHEPVIRYGFMSPKGPTWTLDQCPIDNIKGTFINGVLTSVELINGKGSD